MITITRKYADTLRLRLHTEFALDSVNVSASARDAAGVTRALGVTVVNLNARLFELWTSDPLPVGRHAVDVKYERAGSIIRTATFYLQIRERITP
jgi:hypothetical protein